MFCRFGGDNAMKAYGQPLQVHLMTLSQNTVMCFYMVGAAVCTLAATGHFTAMD